MANLKKLVAGIAFSAMLATMLLATGGDAYAKGRPTGPTTTTTSPAPAPQPGGTFQALGISWE